MLARRSIASLLAGSCGLAGAAPAVRPDASAPAPVAASAAKRVYTPADFARFAPKTAYDMLVQVPSFTIRSADQERGLGQASENVLINGQRIANKSGGAIDQLQRTSAANVDRIEIVDAASLGIAGLSGQVANVILKAQAKGSGPVRAGTRLPRPFYQAAVRQSDGQLFRQDRAARLYGVGRSTSGRGGLGGPVDDLRSPTTSSSKRATRSIIANITSSYFKTKSDSTARARRSATCRWLQSLLEPAIPRRHARAGDRRTAQPHELPDQADGYLADVNGDYEFALGPGPPEGHRSLPSRACAATRHHADPELRQQRRRLAGHALRPRRSLYRGNDRARRISLEGGQQRLAVLARARIQFARPEGRPVPARPAGRLRRGAVPGRNRQGHRSPLRGHRDPSRPLAPTSICRLPPAPRSRRSTASTTISPRANSSGPRAASRSAGGRRRIGTSA